MLIPYNTDAPIYHLPFVTGGLILANVVTFFGMLWLEAQMDEVLFVRIQNALILEYGHGLRPWQWITSNFMHASFWHLLGNMFCFWGFGLVVEGKIGWWRFLLVVLGIGVAQCAAEQTMMLLASGGGSLGASSIIFGLMAISLVWAPRNEMNCIFVFFIFFFFRPIAFEVTVFTLVILALFMEVGTQLFAGFSMTSQVLHLMGAAAGFAVGIAMLRRGWVDCEGWDVFNVWKGTENRAQEEHDAERDAEAEQLLRSIHAKRTAAGQPAMAAPTPVSRKPAVPKMSARPRPTQVSEGPAEATAPFPNHGAAVETTAAGPKLITMRQALSDGDAKLALTTFQEMAADPLYWPLPEAELLKVIVSFHGRKQWLESIPAMEAYLKHFKQRETQVRLKLAQVLLEFAKRPDDALQVLEPLHPPLLPEKEGAKVIALRKRAESGKSASPNAAPRQRH